MASYEVVHDEGDTSGDGTKIHEINCEKYGDAFDPTAPMRVRIAPWTMDTDNDGRKN